MSNEYSRHNWSCGEVISAERLNNIEDGIELALSNGEGGYDCTETRTLLTNETVVTELESEDSTWGVGQLSYSNTLDAEYLAVTVNGTEYICEYDASYSCYKINDDTWLYSRGAFYTQPAGTYSVKIEAIAYSASPTPCFKKAVSDCLGGEVSIQRVRVPDADQTATYLVPVDATLTITDSIAVEANTVTELQLSSNMPSDYDIAFVVLSGFSISNASDKGLELLGIDLQNSTCTIRSSTSITDARKLALAVYVTGFYYESAQPNVYCLLTTTECQDGYVDGGGK